MTSGRTCPRCERTLPDAAFPPNGGKAKRPECRECYNEIRRQRYPERRHVLLARQQGYRQAKGDAWHAERTRKWRDANPDYYAQNRERMRLKGRIGASLRRARIAGVPNERIDPAVVFERSRGLCGVCGNVVDQALFHVDHIIPLVLGGSHTYENVQTTHPTCNRRKGARIWVGT